MPRRSEETLHTGSWNTSTLSSIEYETPEEDSTCVRFYAMISGKRTEVGVLTVAYVNISFYAKQHLMKQPALLDCGIIIVSGTVEKFLIPTGRTRMAGNGSVAVKYLDLVKPVPEDEVEKYERVGIRPPDGVFTYAFFEAAYLARSEDPRRGALFLIDPSMIVLQQPMTEDQKKEFETFGGRKVLDFDVLGAENLQERREEIKRCRMRGEMRRMQYEEADKKWEEEMAERLERQRLEDAEKPKLSKNAKQKARQAEKKDKQNTRSREIEKEAEAEAERLHKQKQAESHAKAEEDLRQEREAEAARKKLEAAEAKRKTEADKKRMDVVKDLLQKMRSSLGGREDEEALQGAGPLGTARLLQEEAPEESADESSDDDGQVLRRKDTAEASTDDA